MLKKCTGTKKIKGCGKFKLKEEFSPANKDMCRECENKLSRERYHGIEHQTPEDKAFNSEISKPWR